MCTASIVHGGQPLSIRGMCVWGLSHLPPKFEHIFVAVITFSSILLCGYFYYQFVAYCVCFKMICKKSL